MEVTECSIEESKLNTKVCMMYSVTYAANVKIKCKLITRERIKHQVVKDDGSVEEKFELVEKDNKEQWVLLTEMPLMNEYGTFIINGCEYVIISQMHRSPGVFFAHDDGKNYSNGRFLYSASLTPSRGSWLDLEFDSRDVLSFRIDKKRRIPLSTLFMACGVTKAEILSLFYMDFKLGLNHESILFGEANDDQFLILYFDSKVFIGTKLNFDLYDKDKNLLLAVGTKLSKISMFKIEKYLDINGQAEFLIKATGSTFILMKDVYAADAKIASYGDLATFEILNRCKSLGLDEISVLLIDYYLYNPYIVDTVRVDKNNSPEAAVVEICRIFRGSDATVDVSVANDIFHNIFFAADKYDLSIVGRIKLNDRLKIKNNNSSVLDLNDIVEMTKELIKVRDGFSDVDDIDHLSNRRVRFVGELVENQIKMSMSRVVKNALDRISSSDLEGLMPYDLIYSRLVSSSIREFFTLSQFSQFMDQTNPLSEITHKRRLSAIGVGGVNRDRAGFEIRDVHYTHYGRICPIETPEGASIGLINSLAVYSTIDEYGFIRTPYRVVSDGVVTDEIHYLSAFEEVGKNIAEINSKVDKDRRLIDKKVSCRCRGEFISAAPDKVNYIDVSSKQILSVASSLIPFIDNDDANRALMGANMQKQAVPLLNPSIPLVGTGMEKAVAYNSGVVLLSKKEGVVKFVDSKIIVLEYDSQNSVESEIEVFYLKKFNKSNYSTSINQSPIVKLNQRVKKNQVLSEGFATKGGYLALGDNILVAFLSWNGYNFEDSIIVSERIVREDIFTSVHLEEFECIVRDTKVGEEQITRNIPNVSEELLMKLDENGLIPIGTEVKAGDILVGKVMPKGDIVSIPEEKLLRAVFGEEIIDVIDASSYVPPGVRGIVIDVKILSRAGLDRDYATNINDRRMVDELMYEMTVVQTILKKRYIDILRKKASDTKIKYINKKYAELLNNIIDFKVLEKLDSDVVASVILDKKDKELDLLRIRFIASIEKVNKKYTEMVVNIADGFGVNLTHGVLKIVKVMVAMKSKLQPGDKMSGRHGNKGVVSKVVPVEDMPFMADGTPIDIILSPLGIPSRMNIGQVLEVHLGMAIFNINRSIKKLIKEKLDGWADKVKNLLKHTYHRQAEIVEQISVMTSEDLIKFGEELNHKLISANVPVFSGQKDHEISELLEVGGFDESGQCDLYDGMTGEKMHRKVTVGIMYLLKLHHLVDNKIHARSIGPYSLVTQQPLGGRSHFGGQRFGEMECWALQGYGAAYTLREMLTVKSDDVVGRIDAYNSIIKGENVSSYGIPESFNVITKELMALGINVEFIQEEKTDNKA